MARKAKGSNSTSGIADDAKDIVDAEVISDDTQSDAQTTDASAQDLPVEDLAAKDEVHDALDKDENALPQDETATDTPERDPSTALPAAQKRGGFVPLVLGGAAAALIGFGAARYVLPDGWPWPGATPAVTQSALDAAIASQTSATSDIAARVAALENGPDLAALSQSLASNTELVTDLQTKLTDVQTALTNFEARLTSLELRPVSEGVSPEAKAAYDAELAALQAAMAKQRAEIEQMATTAAQQKQSAEITEQEAMLRGSVTRIRIALDSGATFGPELENLTAAGQTVPDALVSAASNPLATLTQLQSSFPEAARRALAAARSANGTPTDAGSFLTTLLGARSLTPKEGNDPDAVLSRAEAALAAGRLTDTLAELESLPEAGRIELSDWMMQATARQTAHSAIDAIAQSLNLN